jgi:tryptophan-rich sensory protein
MYFIALFVIAALICATISGYLANQKVEISDVLRTLFIATLLLMVISSFVFFVLNVQHCSLVLMILALILGIGTCIYISQISSLAGWLYFPLVLFLGFATYVMYDIYNKNYSFGITST